MAKPAADYHRGEMDIQEQEATFHGFILMSKWGSLALAVGLVFLVLFFCTKTGFIISALAALVLGVVGLVALMEKKGASGH